MFVLKVPYSVLQALPFKRGDDDSDQIPRTPRPQTYVSFTVRHSQLNTAPSTTLSDLGQGRRMFFRIEML